MADLPENSEFPEGVTQIETDEPVVGGPSGVANRALQQLGNRTRWLKDQFAAFLSDAGSLYALKTGDYSGLRARATTKEDVGLGNVVNAGLSDSVTSTSSTTGASSRAVKTAYDRGQLAFVNAGQAQEDANTAQQAAVQALQTAALKLNTSAYTAADVFGKVKTQDGAGTGLDADLLDGLEAEAFERAGFFFANADSFQFRTAGGFIIQGRRFTSSSDDSQTVTLPQAMGNTNYMAFATVMTRDDGGACAIISRNHTTVLVERSNGINDTKTGLLIVAGAM